MLQHIRYKPGEMITHQGDTADSFYIVIGPDKQASAAVLHTTPDGSEEKEVSAYRYT
jgi:CRP-like cAMP-binding protein